MDSFRQAVTAWAAGGSGDAARDLAARLPVHAAVLLEGLSDAAAVGALAAARGRDPAAEGVCLLPMGGATSIGRFTRVLGPDGLGLRLTGLCDEAERRFYARALEQAGAEPDAFFVCTADLEDELIRALGVDRVHDLIRTQGEERAFAAFAGQPAQRARPDHLRLRRFLGTKSGRKIHYGRALAEALPPGDAPEPLEGLMAAM